MTSPITHNLLLACLLLFAVSCQTTPESTTTSPSPTSTPANSASPAVADTDSNQVNPPAPQSDTQLALSEEGLQLVKDTGSTQLLPFDAEREQVVIAVTGVRGKPAEQGTNSECGAGPLEYTSWADGLTLHSSNGRFVGWNVNSQRSKAAKAYTTMAGIGVGSTRAELNSAYSPLVEQTSLGTEFAAGKLYGLLDSNGADAEVTNLWAGTTCNFR